MDPISFLTFAVSLPAPVVALGFKMPTTEALINVLLLFVVLSFFGWLLLKYAVKWEPLVTIVYAIGGLIAAVTLLELFTTWRAPG